jgi:hypothetical protein
LLLLLLLRLLLVVVVKRQPRSDCCRMGYTNIIPALPSASGMEEGATVTADIEAAFTSTFALAKVQASVEVHCFSVHAR